MRHISFPSIDQFRSVVKEVRGRADKFGYPYPVLSFRGFPKIHGTNASIVLDRETGHMFCQSRSRILTLEDDNAGFYTFFYNNFDFFKTWLESFSTESRYVSVYGEWCGKGIQKGVAVSELDRMFIAFAVRFSDIDDEGNSTSIWNFDDFKSPDTSIFHAITEFPSWDIEIDFNKPEESISTLIALTEQVEAECPVGSYFGIKGIGEGIVWHKTDSPSAVLFKVKGEKHSVSKVKKLASVDVEVIRNIEALVESVVTENRLQQGLDSLREMGLDPDDSSNTKDFISWVRGDVIKEETDTILASGLDTGKVLAVVASKAGKWFNRR